MIKRRHVVSGAVVGTVLGLVNSKKILAQEGPVELSEAPFDLGNAKIAVPTCTVLAVPSTGTEPIMFTDDIDALWRSPWDIGTKSFEIGCTVVQRFIGTDDQGFSLGSDGVVFQSVIYGKYGFQQYFLPA